jgi:hypothetical protein
MAAARDPVLDREIDALQTTLFAPRRAAADWSPHQLVQRIGSARRTLQRHSTRSELIHALPRQLNPIGGGIAPSQRRRPPAR